MDYTSFTFSFLSNFFKDLKNLFLKEHAPGDRGGGGESRPLASRFDPRTLGS